MHRQSGLNLLAMFAVTCCSIARAQVPATAVAAKCQVTQTREVGLAKLVRMNCTENKLSMELWMPLREKDGWLAKDVVVNVIPLGTEPDVRVSPGRAPRSDYMKLKPVHMLITAGGKRKLSASLVGMTFH